MVDLSEYERVGDLGAPFELTKWHVRAQEQSERLREAVRCVAVQLTWDEYVAGEPCPGCGLPYSDESGWESKAEMYFTDSERERYESEEARFMERHGACDALRHSVSGSLRLHCRRCCPVPPMSPARRMELVFLFREMFDHPEPVYNVMRWRLRLYCGHVVEQTAHYTHITLHAAFVGRSTHCTECGLDPASIVDGAAIGLECVPPWDTVEGARRAPSRQAESIRGRADDRDHRDSEDRRL